MSERRASTMATVRTLAAGFILMLGAWASGQESAEIPRLEPEECVTQELAAADADCYRFYGQENRDDPNDTVVELPVGIIPPNSGVAPSDDPLFYFPGGPGGSPLRGFDWLRDVSADRAVVLIDHRGFVNAKPHLECPGSQLAPWFNQLSPAIVSSTDTWERLRIHAESVERCYEKLVSEGIDVAHYNEYDVARDVDEIRALLGYDKINILGWSTGGGGAISYLRYYQENVRSMVLGAPWFGEYRNRAAIDEFYTLKQKYTDILGLCVAEDPHCRELLPTWYYAIDRARRALDEKPFSSIVETASGEQRTLSFDGVALMGKIYRDFENIYARLPNVLSRIQRDDYSALDDFFGTDQWVEVSGDDTSGILPYGYYLAHICGDLGTNRPSKDDVRAMLEREPALLGFEDIKICAWWGVDGAVPPEHNDRFHSDVPGLSLHGQVDSCCGIRWGHYVARTMPNLQLVEFQALGHGIPGPCRTTMIAAFLEDPHAVVDDSCTNDVPLGPWVFQ